MNPPDLPATPPNGHDPERTPELRVVRQRLGDLRPAEPPAEARDRLWLVIAGRLDAAESPEQAAGRQLQALRPSGPTAETEARLRRRLQAGLAAEPKTSATLTRPLGLARRLAFVAALVVLALAVTVNNVAQAALPGEALYPVKRMWEGARLALAVLPDARARVALDLAEERIAEADALVAEGRSPELVAQTVADAVNSLNAAGQLDDAQVAAVVGAWQQTSDQWPPAYDEAAAALDNFLSENPVLGPLVEATATGTITPLPTHTVEPAETQALPAATASPTPTQPPSATPTTPATASPTATTVATTALPTTTVDPIGTGLPTLPVSTLVPGVTPPGLTATVPPSQAGATATLPLPTLTLPPILPSATATRTPNGGSGPVASSTPILPLPTVTLPIPTITLPVP